MGTVYSGFTPSTPEHLLLDAGAFLKNFDPVKDTFEAAVTAGKLIGATAGGGSFSAVPEIRQIEVDGVKGEAKGMKTIDAWKVALTANVKEITAEALKMTLAAAKVETEGDKVPEGYQRITARNDLALDDYCDNVVWIGRLSGSLKPVIIEVSNALATNGLSITMADKSEATIPITMNGHYDAQEITDLETPPFAIYYPKMDAAAAAQAEEENGDA